MPVYAYKGVTSSGKATKAFVDAESIRAARGKLRKEGVFLTEIEETDAAAAAKGSKGPRQLPSFGRVSIMDTALATRQLATLLQDGILKCLQGWLNC